MPSLIFLQSGGNPPRVRRVDRQCKEDLPPKLWGAPGEVATKRGRYRDGILLGPETVYVSPLVGDLTLDDFPDETVFNDEITRVLDVHRVVNGEEVVRQVETLVVVFPYDTVLSPTQIERLREIFEGIPPGNPEENTWRQFAADGALEPDLVPGLLMDLQAAEDSLANRRLIADLEVLMASDRVMPPPPPAPTPTVKDTAVAKIRALVDLTDAELAALGWG